jgi:hypothetical protein
MSRQTAERFCGNDMLFTELQKDNVSPAFGV